MLRILIKYGAKMVMWLQKAVNKVFFYIFWKPRFVSCSYFTFLLPKFSPTPPGNQSQDETMANTVYTQTLPIPLYTCDTLPGR